ncbi:MAG: hypothetical protein IPK64_01795 [bacterium]|nr:hypothetical protein [bacterium]
MTEQGTLTIEVTTGHCLGGEGNDVFPGQILVAPKDLSIAEARKKVRMGYARVVPSVLEAGPEASAASGPAAISHGDPIPENRDPDTMAPQGRGIRPRAGGR